MTKLVFEHGLCKTFATLSLVSMRSSLKPRSSLVLFLVGGLGALALAASNTFSPQESPLPEASNALAYFQRASQEIPSAEANQINLLLMQRSPDRKEAEALLRKHASALQRVIKGTEVAKSRSSVRWKSLSTDSELSQEVTQYNNLGASYGLLLLNLNQSSASGKTTEALKGVRQLLDFARLTRAAHPTTQGWMQAINAEKNGLEAIDAFAEAQQKDALTLRLITKLMLETTWSVGDAQESVRSHFKLGSAVLKAVLEKKADPKIMASYVFHTAKAGGPDIMMVLGAVGGAGAPLSQTKLKTLQNGLYQDASIVNARLNNCDYNPGFTQQAWDAQTKPAAYAKNVGQVLRAAVHAQLNTMLQLDCNWRAQHNMLALKYAIRAFELEQRALPKTLVELVPKYLKQLPVSPYKNQAIRYDVSSRVLTCPAAGGKALGEGWGMVTF